MVAAMVDMLKHCFHRVKARLQDNDPAVFDCYIPKENNYRHYLAEYIEEFASPFTALSDDEPTEEEAKLIFQNYYISHSSLNCMLSFLQDFSQKPFPKIELNQHREGIKAFKNFVRRWENNAQGSDLVEYYKKYNESLD